MRKIMNLAVLLLFLLALVSCTKNTNSTKTYTISFASNNGEQYDSITIDGQQKINLPQPTKEGYSFRGWYPNQKYQDGTEVTSNTIIGKTITLYAKWEPLDIMITFNLDNGTFLEEAPTTRIIKAGESLELPRAYKENYLFIGYAYNGQPIDENTTFTRNATIDAIYLSRQDLNDTYAVSFVLNGGSFYELSGTYPYDGVVNNFTRSLNNSLSINLWQLYYDCFNVLKNHLIGYDAYFGNDDNWNNWRWLMMFLASLTEGETSQYLYNLATTNYEQLASTYKHEQYAIINEIDGLINYTQATNTEGGKEYISIDYYQISDSLKLTDFLCRKTYEIGDNTYLPIPIRDGYEFMGWCDNEELTGEAVFMIKYNEYGDKTYYAKWQKQ